jgi:dienelactone hydrolase
VSRHPITEQPVVLQLPGMHDVAVERDLPYAHGQGQGQGQGPDLGMDIYRPMHRNDGRAPAVIFVSGYSDIGARKLLGCRLKDMTAYVNWAQLVACEGMVGITYENEDPVRDVRLLIRHVTENAGALGIDPARLGIWSCSGNVPNALATLQSHPALRCAALCYGYLLDAPEPGGDPPATAVAEAARQFGFVNPAAGMAIADLGAAALLIVRAGRDATPGLNACLDRFVAAALAANLPLTVLNQPDGPHAFDITAPGDASAAAIRLILRFLSAHLDA